MPLIIFTAQNKGTRGIGEDEWGEVDWRRLLS